MRMNFESCIIKKWRYVSRDCEVFYGKKDCYIFCSNLLYFIFIKNKVVYKNLYEV